MPEEDNKKIPPLSAYYLHAVPPFLPFRAYAGVGAPLLRLLYQLLLEHLQIVVDNLIPPLIPSLGLSCGSGTLDPLDQRGPQATRHLSLAFDLGRNKSHLVRSCYRVPISMCRCKLEKEEEGSEGRRDFTYTLRAGLRVTQRCCARLSIRGGRAGGLG